jgi:superfamily II DNA or RNA helicase
MADIGQRSVGKSQVQWLNSGPGAHGTAARTPDEVTASLAGRFLFAEEKGAQPGLRKPQLGALHAILAHRSTESTEPITIVMPTGTGKTETMLAAFAYSPSRTLVIVPSDALRAQIANKFVTLGVLPEAHVVVGDFLCPVVGVMKATLQTADECDALFEPSNVIVATAAALAGSATVAVDRLVELSDRLFVDEAHHIAARTWRSIADKFSGKPVVQFTATPFREDGQHLGSCIPYAYPLRLAQKHRYFAAINYHAISDLGNQDRAVAEAAIEQLRQDLAGGLDHVLMARVQSIPRAIAVLELYSAIAPDLNPVRLDSKMAKKHQAAALAALKARTSRVIVCVDMLGEGFDLPALKIAAVHDPHKSLSVTLQFIGRFARVGGDDLGEASVFVPRHAGDIDGRLRRLYGEDSDWNIVIRDLTEAEVGREQDRSDFEAGFGSAPTEVALRSLQPKMSTVVYRSNALEWNPDVVYELFGEGNLLTSQIGINAKEHVAWFVTEEKVVVGWGEFSTFGDVIHHLYVLHADLKKGLLYINSSDNSSIHKELAEAVGGAGTALIRGDEVYRVLHPIARRVPTNVGLLDAVNRNRRFSMHVGADVLEGFGPTAAQKSKTNIYAHGYAYGGRVSVGASRKGRVWTHRVAYNLLDWVKWAQSIGATITDESISVSSVMAGFIIPTAATQRPPLVPLGIEWPYTLIGNTSEARQVTFDGASHSLLDLDLSLTAWDATNPIAFEVRSDDWTIGYEMTFTDEGPVVRPTSADAQMEIARGSRPLSEFMTETGMTVFFEQEAVLSPDGYLIQPDRARPKFDADSLETVDWTGINIQKESQGPNRDADSIQHRVVELLSQEAEWDVIIDDDGKGEVADVVCLRRSDRVLDIVLAHCKYSHGPVAGARLADLYEVCGQAVKSHKARSEAELILRKLRRREKNRLAQDLTGFIKGQTDDLLSILQGVRLLDVRVTVLIAQPGLSKGSATNPLFELLGCTQLYLSETYNSSMRVMCSA